MAAKKRSKSTKKKSKAKKAKKPSKPRPKRASKKNKNETKIKKTKKPKRAVKKKVKKSVGRGARKPARKKTVKRTAAKNSASNDDILEKFSRETGIGFDKPKSLDEFDKHLEETAKLVTGESDHKDLPHFTDDHVEEAKKMEKDLPSTMADEKETTPEPEHHVMSAEKSHPFTDHGKKSDDSPFNQDSGIHESSLFDERKKHHDPLPKHHRHAINATVLAFFGVIVPLISILAFIVAIKAIRKGSHTGKGAAFLSVATFIINLALIYFFYTLALGLTF